MSHNSENGFFATIDRLWRSVTAGFWIVLLFLVPALALVGIGRAYRRRRAASSKHERKYWTSQIFQCWCILYMAVVLYFHLFQDFLPGGLERQAKMVDWFDSVMGLPGVIWYIYTDREIAKAADSSQFLMVTFWSVLVLFFITLFVDYFKVYGSIGMDGEWESPRRVNKQRIAEEERRLAPQRALSSEWFKLQREHPRNHPSWADLSDEQRNKLTAKWEAKKKDLFERMERCDAELAASQPK